MVHVKRCPCEYGRGMPTTEFYKIEDGKRKPQIYCYGWHDARTDDALQCCLDCDDFVYGEQCEKDFEKYKAEKNNSVDVYELFEVDNSFHDSVIRLANAFGKGIAEVLEQLNRCVNAFDSVAKGVAGSLEQYAELFKNLKELEGIRSPGEIKKELKHEKNPMRIKQLNRELTESYKRYSRKKGTG